MYLCEMWFVIAVLLINVILLALGKINYCGSKICSHTNAHTFCQFFDGPGPQCKGFIEAPLSDEEKMRILIRLNQRRAAAAAGRLRRFPPASDMMKLTWVNELAREAQLWANQCEPPGTPEGHDACRDLYSVSVGQCVASVVGEAPGLKPESMVDLWYMQNMFYKDNVSQYSPPSSHQINYYGDFAQLLYAQAYMVGCARSRFMVPYSGRMRTVERLVCNFAPRGPAPARAIWTVGGVASNCPPRSMPDANIPALCDYQHDLDESVDQDNIMSLEAHILLDTVNEIQQNESLNYMGSIDEIYLTKVAMVSMKDIVPVQDNNGVQKRNVYDSDTPNNAITGDPEQSVHSILRIIETAEVTPSKPPNTTFSLKKLNLIGRPKSYNIEDLNEDADIEAKLDNRQVLSHEFPVREKEFDLDYEFTDANEDPVMRIKALSTTKLFSTVTTEISTSTPVSTSLSSEETTQTNEIETLIILTTPSTGSPQTTDLFTTQRVMLQSTYDVFKLNDNDTVTLNLNDTDALLADYLNDPETVKKLQEEIDRIEQTALPAASAVMASPESQPSTIFLDQTERAEKVRRAIKEEYGKQIDNPTDAEGLGNFTDLQYGSEPMEKYPSRLPGRNISFDLPMLDMVKKYLPFLNQYSNGILGSKNHAVYSEDTSFFVVLVPTLLVSVVL